MKVDDFPAELDLGEGHLARTTFVEMPDGSRHIYGLLIKHQKTVCDCEWPSGKCSGGIVFDTPELHQYRDLYGEPPAKAAWTVECWDPLTLSPSILCHCGDHGHIREGRWIPA